MSSDTATNGYMNQICAREGLSPGPTIGELAGDTMLAYMRGRCRAYLGNGDPEFVNFGVGSFEERSVNAFATVYEGRDFIMFSSGAFAVLPNLFAALVTHPHFLPDIGQVGEGETPFVAATSAREVLLGEALNPPLMEDPERQWLAENLALIATMYIFEHELAHLASGHVDLIQERGSLNILAEINNGKLPIYSGLIRQTIEWDADTTAIQSVLATCLNPEVDTLDGFDRWHVPEENNFGSPARAVRIISAAVLICSYVFAVFDASDPNDFETSHPHPFFRAIAGIGQIAHVMSFRGGDRYEDWYKLCSDDIEGVVGAWLELFGTSPAAGYNHESLTESFRVKFEAYTKCWTDIHADLGRLKRPGVRLAPATYRNNPHFEVRQSSLQVKDASCDPMKSYGAVSMRTHGEAPVG